MKKTVLIVLAVVMVSATGCKKSEEAGKAAAPQAAAQSVVLPAAVPPAVPPAGQIQVAPKTPATQVPAAVPAGGDPHAGLKLKEMAAGTGHKGKVLQTMDAAGYTYVEVEEKGQKLWLAVMKTAVKKGDIVEFPDSPPMLNFESKTLKRTFDKIIFAETLRVVK